MREMTKIATLRVVKENGERKWWNSLEKAFSSSTRLVRAQTDRAHKTIFGGCRINSLSAAAPISTFLNPLSKKEFGCEGWSNQKYIARWCNGDESVNVRRIDFTFLHYVDLSDHEVSPKQLGEVIAKTPISRIRHRTGSAGEILKLSVPVPTMQKHGTDRPSSSLKPYVSHVDPFPLDPPQAVVMHSQDTAAVYDRFTKLQDDERERNSKLQEDERKRIAKLQEDERDRSAKQQEDERGRITKLHADELERTANRQASHDHEKAEIIKLLNEAQQQLKDQNKVQLLREQSLMDDVRREQRANKQAKRENKEKAKQRDFVLAMMQSTNFASLSTNPTLQPVVAAMMQNNVPSSQQPLVLLTNSAPPQGLLQSFQLNQ